MLLEPQNRRKMTHFIATCGRTFRQYVLLLAELLMIVIVGRLVNDWGSTLQENWFMYSGVILYSYLCSLPDKRSVMLCTDKALWGS